MSQQTYVLVDNLVAFATNRGIEIIESERFEWEFGGQIDLKPIMDNPRWPLIASAFEEALGLQPLRLTNALQKALEHYKAPLLARACCGGEGPLANLGTISFERYLEICDEHERWRAKTTDKQIAAQRRRWEFGSRRADLIAEMLDRGFAYQCAHPGCIIIERLTVDHIMPLSRGGTDDVENLQFMCRPHNSAKGNRI